MEPLTQEQAADALGNIPSPVAGKSVAQGGSGSNDVVILDYSGTTPERALYGPLLYQLIRHTGTVRLSLVNTPTTQADVEAICEQVAALYAAEGWFPKLNIQDSPYFQGGAGFHGSEPVDPSDNQYDAQVTSFITGKLNDFWGWLTTAASANGISAWLSGLVPANDIIYCFDHEVWDQTRAYSSWSWNQTRRDASADRADVIVAAYNNHANLGGGQFIWYSYEGIDLLQGLDGWYDPPINRWVPSADDVPNIKDRLFPGGQDAYQSHQSWHSLYTYLIAEQMRRNEAYADANSIPKMCWWMHTTWNRALTQGTGVDDLGFASPVRARDLYYQGRQFARGNEDPPGDIVPATRIAAIAFYPGILTDELAGINRWSINAFVDFMLGMAEQDSADLYPLLGDGIYRDYPEPVQPSVKLGEVVLESDPNREQESSGGRKFNIWQRMQDGRNDWLRWEVSEIRAQWFDDGALSNNNLGLPTLVRALRGKCYSGVRLSGEDLTPQDKDAVTYKTDKGDDDPSHWFGHFWVTQFPWKTVRTWVPDHLQGKPNLKMRVWYRASGTHQPIDIHFSETGGWGSQFLTVETTSPDHATLTESAMACTEWVDVPATAGLAMIGPRANGWTRIFGVDFIDVDQEAEPDAVVDYDRKESFFGDPTETVQRQGSLMYDGPGGTADRIVGPSQEAGDCATGKVDTPEHRLWWGTTSDASNADARSAGGMVGGLISGSYAVNFGDLLNQVFNPAADTARRIKTTQCEIALTGWHAMQNADGTGTRLGTLTGYFRFGGHPGIEIQQQIAADQGIGFRVWQHWRNVAVTPRDVRWVQSAGTEQDVDVEGGTDDAEIAITSYTHPTLTFGVYDNDTMIGVSDKDSQWSPAGQFFEPKTAGHQRMVLEHLDRADGSPFTVASGGSIGCHYFISVGDGAAKRVSNEARA